MFPKILSSKAKGQTAENAAKKFLLKQNLKLISQNFQFKLGEIDLIFTDKNTLIFVEVRSRKSSSHGSPVQTVTPNKQRRIIKTAKYFLCTHLKYQNFYCRFDIIGLTPYNDGFKIEWLKDAFYEQY